MYLSLSMKFLSYQPMVKALSIQICLPGSAWRWAPRPSCSRPKSPQYVFHPRIPNCCPTPRVVTDDLNIWHLRLGLWENRAKRFKKKKGWQEKKKNNFSSAQAKAIWISETLQKKRLGTPLGMDFRFFDLYPKMPGFCRICRTFVVMPRKRLWLNQLQGQAIQARATLQATTPSENVSLTSNP